MRRNAPAAVACVVLACIVLVFPGSAARADEPGTAEQELARLLAVAPGGASGSIEGHRASFWVEPGGGRSHASPTTNMRVAVPTPLLRVSVHAHSDWDDEQSRAGHLVEVSTDDAAFDHAWVASGAPSDLVRTLLDEPLRRALIKNPEVGFSIDGEHLDVWEARLLTSADEAREFAGIAARVTRRLATGLRPAPGIAETPEAQQQDLLRLERAQKSRRDSNLVFVAMMAVVGAFLAGGLVFRMQRRRPARELERGRARGPHG